MKSKIFYKGSKELFQQAKTQAKKEHTFVGDWIDQAIREKLNKKEGK